MNRPKACVWCGEPFEPKDDRFLKAFPFLRMHQDCGIRAIAGSVGHLEGRCSCFGGDAEDPPGMSVREAATAAANVYRARERAQTN